MRSLRSFPVILLTLSSLILFANGQEAIKSAHFKTVAEHLDPGGVFYGYMDVAGDLDSLLELGQNAYGQLREIEDAAPAIDFKSLVSELGLHNIAAVGGSSVAVDTNTYRNQAFILTPKGFAGLLKIFGGEAKPFKALSLAPTGADIVIEGSFQLSAIRGVLEGVLPKLPDEAEAPDFDELMQEQVPNTGLTLGEILTKSNGVVTVIASVNDKEKIAIPNVPIKIPAIDFMIRLDGMGWLFEKLQGMLPPERQGPFTYSKEGGITTISVEIPKEVPFSYYQPILIHDKEANLLTLASRAAYLDTMKPGAAKLAASAAYKAIARDLPTSGNSFSFMSAEFGKTVNAVLAEAMRASGAPGGAEKFLELLALNLQPAAGVWVNKPNGMHAISYGTQSIKSAIKSAMTAVATTVPMVIGGAAFTGNSAELALTDAQVEEEGREGLAAKGDIASLQTAIAAIRLYATDNDGKFPDTLSDLTPDHLSEEEAGKVLKWPSRNGSPSALVYFNGMNMKTEGKTIVLASPEPNGQRRRAVAYVDGTAEMVSEDDFFRLARAAIKAASE